MSHLRSLAVFLLVIQLPLITGAGAEAVQQEPGPPHPAPVPANRCRITGVVQARRQLPDESGLDAILPVPPDTALEALKIKVTSTDKVSPDLPSFCRPGMIAEVFTDKQQRANLVGKRIVAEIELLGSTSARHWWLHRLELADSQRESLAAEGGVL